MVVGLIPDGNRRWAKKHSYYPEIGHDFGITNLENIMAAALPKVEHLYVYLLAWHNWGREERELDHLFNIYVPLVREYYNHPKVTLQLGQPPRQVGKPIDIVVRTGGNKRLSGFFPEESKGAKVVVLKKYWPEFTISDLDDIITAES